MKQIYCSFFGHNYEITRNVTFHVKEYTCKQCHQQVTTNGNGKLIILTPKYKEINSVLERVHNKRLKRKSLILDR
jgi:RNA polymerase subunit RPABC4/transcription elongation factor Spt4